MSARATFKQSDMMRAVKVAVAAGLPVCGIEVNDNGFRVLVGEGSLPRRKNKADELYGPA